MPTTSHFEHSGIQGYELTSVSKNCCLSWLWVVTSLSVGGWGPPGSVERRLYPEHPGSPPTHWLVHQHMLATYSHLPRPSPPWCFQDANTPSLPVFTYCKNWIWLHVYVACSTRACFLLQTSLIPKLLPRKLGQSLGTRLLQTRRAGKRL